MFQQFFLKQMLAKQLSSLPKEQQERALAALDKNPDFFKKIIEEIGARVKNGEQQMPAIMAVVTKHKAELEDLLKG